MERKVKEGQILSLLELRHPSSLPSDIGAPGSQAFGLKLNYTTGFHDSPVCRSWIVGLDFCSYMC